MSGCDTLLHLFGCEVLIKSESNARQPTSSSFVYPLERQPSVDCRRKGTNYRGADRQMPGKKQINKQQQTCDKKHTSRKERWNNSCAQDVLGGVKSSPGCCLFSVAVTWNGLSYRQSARCPHTQTEGRTAYKKICLLSTVWFSGAILHARSPPTTSSEHF